MGVDCATIGRVRLVQESRGYVDNSPSIKILGWKGETHIWQSQEKERLLTIYYKSIRSKDNKTSSGQ
jgi:hypothetical protein